jgi:hypothetical protein
MRPVLSLTLEHSMNVTSPTTHHIPQAIPLKRNNESSTNGAATTPTVPATPSNPSHLGNSIDTTA